MILDYVEALEEALDCIYERRRYMAQCHFFMKGGDRGLEGKGWRRKGVG